MGFNKRKDIRETKSNQINVLQLPSFGGVSTSSEISDKLIVTLYNLLVEETKTLAKEASSREGFSFEDRVSQRLYENIRKYSVSVLPPRSTLNYPTVSGLKHQFDGVVMDGNTFLVIECKRRGLALIDQVFSFNSKILDYALNDSFSSDFCIKGIFLSTARLTENIKKYALAYGILAIDSTLPPVEVMIDKMQIGDKMREELLEMKRVLALSQPTALKSRRNCHELFQRYIICYQKWKEKGYE